MIDTFLKAKNWQLFIVMLGIPLLFQLFIVFGIFSFSGKDSGADFLVIFIIASQLIPIITLIFGVIFFGWLWSIAIGLQQCIPSTVKMKVTKFKIFFFIPLVYISFLMLHMSGFIAGSLEGFEWVFALVVPLHLFSMFCMFYMLYFVAKTIKTLELQREVKFGEFLAEFFLLWFYFIGIWIIQPKVNTFYNKYKLR